MSFLQVSQQSHRLSRNIEIFNPIAYSFFHLPVLVDEDKIAQDIPIHPKHIAWSPEPCSSAQEQKYCDSLKSSTSDGSFHTSEMLQVLSSDDLYYILGIPRSPTIDKVTIRRAYLSRSRACHPEYVPGTYALTVSHFCLYLANCLETPMRRMRSKKSPLHTTSSVILLQNAFTTPVPLTRTLNMTSSPSPHSMQTRH